ncbi:hypothetical protein, partial [Paucilactobacillus suebicus]
MPDEKRRIESCMQVNGYQGYSVRFDKSSVDEYVYHVCWSDGKKYLINVDRFTVDEIGVDDVGE